MPVVLPSIVGVLVPNLASVGLIGESSVKLANGVANGLVLWIPQVTVQTVDVGTLGSGKNVPLPLTVPPPTLLGALQASLAGFGFAGIAGPQIATGLANGLSSAFTSMLVSTQHPSVGAGTGVGKLIPPPAAGPMVQGFAAASLVGLQAPKLASAIGTALTTVFASLVVPLVIVGPSSPTGSGGTGFGNII